MTDSNERETLLELTTEIVSAYFSNNQVRPEDIRTVVQSVHSTLAGLGGSAQSPVSSHLSTERPDPAVPVKKSITADFIVCLEDGKKLKMLKRHLKTSYDMTPDEYRERWGLPSDYPMVAPNYARQRSRLAKEIGLGTQRRNGGRKKKAA